MKRSALLLTFFSLGLAILLAGTAVPQDPATDAAADPQTHGPLHEAFIELTVATPQPGPITPKKPPDPIEELPPEEQPQGNNIQWISGYWTYDDESADYLWVSGFWRDVPPDRRWVPGYWSQHDADGWQRVTGYWEQAGQTDVEYLPTPPQNIDAGPSIPAPAAESVYAPGSWVFHETRYMWRPGFWVAPHPGWIYVPARYSWTPVGYIFCNGYWDYPLETRGVVFCPVVIDRAVWRADWVYRPRYALSTPALLTALFVRPAFGHYYFGNYFASGYAKAGFVPWTEYAVVRGAPDPLFGFYRAHRDRDWITNLQQVYVDRREGRLPPPPASLNQQTQIIQNITQVTNVKNTIQINSQNFKVADPRLLAQQLTMVAPLAQISKVNTNIKLQAVSKDTMVSAQRHIAQTHQVAQERKKLDVQAAQIHAKAEKTGEPRPSIKLALPKVAAAVNPATEVKGAAQKPPLPPAPKPVAVKPPEHKEIKPPRLDAKPFVIHPKDEKVQPKEEKKPPVIIPKEEKKPPVVIPKEEKKPPVIIPKEEKKPPVIIPKEEKKPPVVIPKEEKKPPVVIPKEEKKPPVVIPKEEKKPPVVIPKEEKKPPTPKDKAPAKDQKDQKPPETAAQKTELPWGPQANAATKPSAFAVVDGLGQLARHVHPRVGDFERSFASSV